MTNTGNRPRQQPGSVEARFNPRRADASMLLLNEVIHAPVDPGYAVAAERKKQGLEPPRRLRTTIHVTAIALLLGFAAATATSALRAPQPDLDAARNVLEQEIRERRSTNESASQLITELDREIEQIQTAALSDRYPALLTVLGRDAAASGAVGVEGPGLTVKLKDGVQPQEGDVPNSNVRVQDYDLQILVNSLWAAGAEAIAINGQRLTTRSAIRSAGDAILVDLVGLSGPYEVEAIGDPATMPTYFSRSIAQQHLSLLNSRYGISSSLQQHERLQLPAGQSSRLFHAAVPEDLELQKSDTASKSARENKK